MSKLRIGILGTGVIARKNWRAIHESGNAVISAIASRDQSRCQQFIREGQEHLAFEKTPVACGRYEELIASPDVDAVYNPLPTGLRKEWILKAAAAGKHVICEKPCGLSLADVREMTDACARNNVQFMDGVMFMHNRRLDRIRAALDDSPNFGEIKRITSVFGFNTAAEFYRDNIRVHSALEPTGCLGDLGWYCLRFALWTMRWQVPREVTGRIIAARGNDLSPAPVPVEFSSELFFDGGASAAFYCAFVIDRQQTICVNGSKGNLCFDDFVHPKDTFEPTFELNHREVRVEKLPRAQDANLFHNFAAQVFSGKLNEDWPIWALKTQQVMDACHASAVKGTCLKLET